MKDGNANNRITWLCAKTNRNNMTSNAVTAYNRFENVQTENTLARIESTMSSIAIFSSVSILAINSLPRRPPFECGEEKNDYYGLRTGFAYRDVQPPSPSGRNTKAKHKTVELRYRLQSEATVLYNARDMFFSSGLQLLMPE